LTTADVELVGTDAPLPHSQARGVWHERSRPCDRAGTDARLINSHKTCCLSIPSPPTSPCGFLVFARRWPLLTRETWPTGSVSQGARPPA